jgi:predicted enzyme related to lactoylglutathione lyase
MADIKVLVYPAKDVEKAKTLMSAFLGVQPYVDSPYYVGYKVGDLEVGLDPNGSAIIAYTDVTDIEQSLKELVDAGAEIVQGPKDVGGGLLIAQLKDANGNIVGLRAPAKA